MTAFSPAQCGLGGNPASSPPWRFRSIPAPSPSRPPPVPSLCIIITTPTLISCLQASPSCSRPRVWHSGLPGTAPPSPPPGPLSLLMWRPGICAGSPGHPWPALCCQAARQVCNSFSLPVSPSCSRQGREKELVFRQNAFSEKLFTVSVTVQL